ncbi:alanine--tRNA ligase-related protein [Vibrio harveyi]|uniref:alanine--tRNA ligase-related protein n=1 Tax=Vibrio harveyi TaxID=669 RepID=UPI0018F19AEE|nr:alanine--tRNA ligase-related protein [Vibrio harveyi]
MCIRDRGEVVALYREGEAVESANAGEEVLVVLDNTPFYAESGGQCGDAGWISASEMKVDVADTQKFSDAIGHSGVVLSLIHI